MKKTANVLKKAFSLFLCICLMASLCIVAAAEGTTSVGEITHSYVSGEGAAITYKAEVKVYNYSETPMKAVLLTLLLDGGKIVDLKTTPVTDFTGGKTISHEITTTAEGQTLRSFIWTSLNELTPLVTTKTPAAPTGVTVDETTITNSTVDLTWTASEDSDAVAYYNVYRDGKYVGSTADATTSLKDVGIAHSTDVSYTVSAVDYAGKEGAKSEASAVATTDTIARLWLGAAASEIAEGNTSATLASTDYDKIANENITPHYFILGDGTNESTIEAVGEEYEFNTSQKLGLSAMKFGQNMARVLATIPEGDFLTALKADENKEMKVIMNTYDYYAGTPSYVTNIGRNATALIRYSHSNSLAGATGAVYDTTNKWNTTELTVPLPGSSGTYSDVFSNRAFALSNISSAGQAVQNTDGQSTMFSIGNGTTNRPVYIQKVDFAASDYVPYGAVLDFENQGDSQFVHFIRRNGYNPSEITEMAASTDSVSKKAYKLDAISGKQLYLAFDADYIDANDNDLIVRVTYLDNKTDATNAEGLQLIYKNASGVNAGDNYIKREGSGTWKTAEFYINDAALSTNWDSLVLSVPEATGENAFYVSRVEVINRNPN